MLYDNGITSGSKEFSQENFASRLSDACCWLITIHGLSSLSANFDERNERGFHHGLIENFSEIICIYLKLWRDGTRSIRSRLSSRFDLIFNCAIIRKSIGALNSMIWHLSIESSETCSNYLQKLFIDN